MSRIRFIFNFTIVFIEHFLKMASVSVRFSPGFYPGAEFTGEHVFCGVIGAPAETRSMLEQPHFAFVGMYSSEQVFPESMFFADFQLLNENHATVAQPH
jgi:hypothetical protein